ncbi:MAG: NfeD family protein [Microcoleaceae cyanobacterium]
MINFSSILLRSFPYFLGLLLRSSSNDAMKSAQPGYEKRYSGAATVLEAELSKQLPYWQGRVAFRGTTWKAKTLDRQLFREGDVVEVLGITNITLVVQQIESARFEVPGN